MSGPAGGQMHVCITGKKEKNFAC